MSSELSGDDSAAQILENQEEIEDLENHIEEHIRTVSDERKYFSTDVVSLGNYDVTVDVYGVENHPMPEKRRVAAAVGSFYDWEVGYEEHRSTEDMYSIRVVDWNNTSAPI